jgi:integrase
MYQLLIHRKELGMRELLLGTVSERTLTLYEKAWREYEDFCVSSNLPLWSSGSVLAWRTSLVEARYSPNTINSALSAIKSIFAASVAAGSVSVELYTQVRAIASVSVRALRDRLRKGNVPLDDIAVQEIIDNIDTSTPKGLRDKAMLCLLATSGVRIEELCGLRGDQWRIPERVIYVQGKTDIRPRAVPVAQVTEVNLTAWLFAREIASAWLFNSFAGRSMRAVDKPITTQGAYNVVVEAARKMGIDASPHDFRRYVATKLAEGNIVEAQAVLGHASIVTTQRYVKRAELPSVDWLQ